MTDQQTETPQAELTPAEAIPQPSSPSGAESPDHVVDLDALVVSDGATVSVPASSGPSGSTVIAPNAEGRIELTCPSCGYVGQVDFGRRDAEDFCPQCDMPLFWAKTRVDLPGATGGGEDALRRLPGTAGRASLAAIRCPACNELNPSSRDMCVRCGSELRPRKVAVAGPPPPQPVVEPGPDKRRLWWPWLVAVLVGIAVLVGLLLYYHNR